MGAPEINVNVIQPGYIRTGINGDWFDTEGGAKQIAGWHRRRLMPIDALDETLAVSLLRRERACDRRGDRRRRRTIALSRTALNDRASGALARDGGERSGARRRSEAGRGVRLADQRRDRRFPRCSVRSRFPRGRRGWRKLLAFTGPGYLVAVGYMDPGNWATDLAGGSAFGYTLLAVILLSNLMAMMLQALSARLGIATGRDLASACRDAYPRPVAIALWLLCELAIVACDLAEVIGTAIGLQLLFGMPLVWGVCLTGARRAADPGAAEARVPLAGGVRHAR